MFTPLLLLHADISADGVGVQKLQSAPPPPSTPCFWVEDHHPQNNFEKATMF